MKKEVEQKRVIREGYNSLITHPNASCFSVFSHVRHFVLQNQLCETYNARLSLGDEEEATEKGGDASKKEQSKMPVVCGQGCTVMSFTPPPPPHLFPPTCTPDCWTGCEGGLRHHPGRVAHQHGALCASTARVSAYLGGTGAVQPEK